MPAANEREGKIKFLPNQLKKMNQLNCKCKCCCWGKLHEKHEDKNRFFYSPIKKSFTSFYHAQFVLSNACFQLYKMEYHFEKSIKKLSL
jgi:hypothetical protein